MFYKTKDLNQIFSYTGLLTPIIKPALGGEDRWIPRAYWPANLAKTASGSG